MERILFGDNQFFGINHMSEDRARGQAVKFQNIQEIIDVLQIAYDEGIKTFMCTTHERIAEICDHVRSHSDRYSEFQFYPCMPYAHKYVNSITEQGLLGALTTFLPEEGRIRALVQGGMSLARKDVSSLATLLIDAEMKMFSGLKTPVVFLQNVVTDLILGLGAHEMFRIFADHVQSRYGAEAGFITMNMPRLLDALDACGINNPIICSNINKIGFRMCGGIDAYEQAIKTRHFRPIAMSVLASGAISPHEAIKYICQQPKIKSIVFGASSRAHIRQTKALIDEMTSPEFP